METRFHPAASTEVTEARSWYRERSPLAAVGFAREIARAVRLISEAPNRYPHADHGTRWATRSDATEFLRDRRKT